MFQFTARKCFDLSKCPFFSSFLPHFRGRFDYSIIENVFNPPYTSFRGETPVVALDCEMVQVESYDDALAR